MRPSRVDRSIAITLDGARVVYSGNKGQILVRALETLEPTALTGLGAPRYPFVSPDGQWIGFVDGTSTLKKVAMTGGPAVTIAALDATYVAPGTSTVRQYDVSADGKRFLMIKEGTGDQTETPQTLVVVQHWSEELKRLVPVK